MQKKQTFNPGSLYEGLPANFRYLHEPEFVLEAWNWCCEALRQPAVVVPGAGPRRVILTRSACFEFDETGRLTVSLMRTGANGELIFETLPDARVCLEPILLNWLWLNVPKKRLHDRIGMRDIAQSPELVLAYTEWIFTRIRRALARQFDMRAIRAQVRQALDLSPFFMECARRMRSCMLIATLTHKHHPVALYNVAVQNAEVMQVLMRDAPQAMALWAFFKDDLRKHRAQDTLRVLREHLLRQGLSLQTWRLAIKAGSRLFRHVPQFYPVPKAGMRQVAMDILRLFEILGLKRMPPDWLVHDLYAVFGNAHDRKTMYRLGFGAPGRVWVAEHALRVLSRMDNWGHARRDEVRQVLGWIGDLEEEPPFFPDAPSKRAGWRWLSAQSRAHWAQEERVSQGFNKRWQVPIGACEIDGVSVRPLDSGEALFREGQEMSNCLSHRLTQGYQPSNVLLYALCRGENRRTNRANASIRLVDGSWQVAQVLGFANVPAHGWALQVAKQLANRVNALQAAQTDCIEDAQENKQERCE